MQTGLKIYAKEFAKNIALYKKARRISHADIINRIGAQANFACVDPEAKGGAPRAKLGKFPLNGRADPRKGGRGAYGSPQRYYYARAAALGVKKGKGGKIVMRPKAYEAWARKRKAKGAVVAGCLVCAHKLGLKKKGPKGAQPIPGETASTSKGVKAKPKENVHAYSINKVLGSGEVLGPAMESAIHYYVIHDMGPHAQKIIDKRADRLKAGKKLK